MDSLNPLAGMSPPMKVMDVMEFRGIDAPNTAIDVQCSKNGRLKLVPDEEIYPGLFDTGLMSKCYVIFMKGGSFKDCADTTKVDERTVMKWAQMGDWIKMRSEIEQSADAEEAQRLSSMRRELRLDELSKQIKAGQKLRERVAEKLDDETADYRPIDLKMLGEALKAAGDNTVRALGVSEAGSTKEDDSKVNGKAPLILLIQGGGLPSARPPQAKTENVIDV